MFYYKFTSGTPYCGTENDYYVKSAEPLSKGDLEAIADEYAEQAYQDYSYLHSGWNDENLEGMTEEEFREQIMASMNLEDMMGNMSVENGYYKYEDGKLYNAATKEDLEYPLPPPLTFINSTFGKIFALSSAAVFKSS